VVNSYNPCVANITTRNGSHVIVVWHIDNLMVLCVEDFKLTKFSSYLGNIYRPKLNMHTGKKHDYLGMDMEFNDDKTLDVLMIKYLQNIIKDFLEVITRRVATPATDYLFNVRDKKSKTTGRKTGACIPPYGCTAIVYVNKRRGRLNSKCSCIS
jgi:hypothetical protein